MEAQQYTNTAVGVVAVTLVGIFVRLFYLMVMKIIPDGFELLRKELQAAELSATHRHAEHIGRMDGLQATLDRQEGERQQRIAPRAKRRSRSRKPAPVRSRK